ncbi:MAG: DUF3618 domain-containing protein [Gemmatimonadota bacterium]|nr:DUF3618 domain-containing protein [Gemmatimonadota bacterium]
MTDTHRDMTRTSEADTPSTAEIELEIQRTRARMTENVDALTWKLSPDRLKAQAKHKLHQKQEAVVEKVRHAAHEVGDSARQAGSGLFGTLKENPIPAAMIGAGIAWLVMGSRRRSESDFEQTGDSYGRYYNPGSYVPADTAVTGMTSQSFGGTAGGGIYSAEEEIDYSSVEYTSSAAYGSDLEHSESRHGLKGKAADVRERVSEKTSHARERVAETTSHARERIGETASSARDTVAEKARAARMRAGDLRHGAADRARRTRGWAEHQMDENPLVMGAAIMALGAVVGSLVPTTRKEDELIGRKRDELMDRARSTMHEAREVIGATARETMESVKEEAGMQKDTLRSTAADLSSELKTSAKKVAHDAKETAKTEAEQRKLM